MAFVTLLFRPFPFEAPNTAALVLSFEGLVTAVLIMWRLGAIRRAVFAAFSNPYALFVVIYVIAATLAFSTIGNFSLLGRQRLMVLPMFFMLLAYATAREEATAKESTRTDTDEVMPDSKTPGETASAEAS